MKRNNLHVGLMAFAMLLIGASCSDDDNTLSHRTGNRGIVFLGERTGGLTLLHFHLKTGKKKALSIWAEPSCFPSILLSSLSNISAPVQTPDTRWLLQAYSSQHHLTGSSRALLRAALFPASCLWKTPHRRSTILSEETEPPPAAIRRTGETAEYFPQNTGPAAAGFPRFQTASHPRPFSNPVLWKTA